MATATTRLKAPATTARLKATPTRLKLVLLADMLLLAIVRLADMIVMLVSMSAAPAVPAEAATPA